jgi:subfamily B ATP-binding cassette protein MsbA
MKRFRTLLSFVLPYKWYAFQNIFFNIFSAFLALFTYALFGPFLNILFDKVPAVAKPETFELNKDWLEGFIYFNLNQFVERFGDSGALIGICILVLVASFMKNLFVFLGNNALAFLRAGTTRDIRNLIYYKVLRLPMSYFSEARKGDILTRMSNDVQEIQLSVIGSLTMLMRDPITILIFVIFLASTSLKLTLFAIVILPFSGWIIGRIGRSLRATSFASQQSLGRLLSVLEETLSGLRVIKAFNAEEKMNDQFGKNNERFTMLLRRVIRRRYLASPVSEFLSTIVVLFVLYFGGMLALSGLGEITPDQLIVFIVIFSQLIQPAKSITTAYLNVQKGYASLDRIDVILSADEKIKEKEGALAINSFEEEISFDNVSFAYEKDAVLRNVSMKVNKGETVAVVGKSGSGKSTLVDLLPRFMDVTEGKISIDGKDIRDLKINNLRSILGVVNQQAILFNDTFRNNIAFSVGKYSDEEIWQAARVANAEDFIKESPGGLDYIVGEGGGKLSGGQRQRISIARAVLANPPILILDEATSALDTESERVVQDAIDYLMQSRTSIVIAHRLSTVQHADYIVVLHDGRIAEMGKHNELLKNKDGVYYKLHKMQDIG